MCDDILSDIDDYQLRVIFLNATNEILTLPLCLFLCFYMEKVSLARTVKYRLLCVSRVTLSFVLCTPMANSAQNVSQQTTVMATIPVTQTLEPSFA